MVVSGCVGPRGDGYDPGQVMSPEEAEAYHAQQIRDLRRRRRRHGDRDHDDQRRRGDRRDPRGAAGRPAGGDLLHARDRRPPADRAEAAGRDRGGRRGDRERPRLLHDQLRPSDPLRGRARPAAAGCSACAGCAPTPRAAAMRSSTRRPISTPAIRSSSAASTARCAAGTRSSTCSAAAAAPTTATSSRSATPAGWRPDRRRPAGGQLRGLAPPPARPDGRDSAVGHGAPRRRSRRHRAPQT